MARIAYLTTIEFGPGALASLSSMLGELSIRRPLIVADRGIEAAGLLRRAEKHLPPKSPRFLGVPGNPNEAAVGAALAVYRENACDGLVAIGGALEITKDADCGVGRARVELAGTKNLVAEPHRLAILRNDPVMLGMIDGGDLPADGIAADIDDRKMIGHCRNPYHKKTSNVIG